ncbi:MAG: efflux RND transporter periplasmic adaptor subunit [candidate division WOR-3 bacterium]
MMRNKNRSSSEVRRLLASGLILAGMLSLVGCGGKGSSNGLGKERMVVGTGLVKRGTITKSAELFGRVSGADEAQVYSEFPGKVRYTVKEGQRVSRGQTIAYIDRSLPGVDYQPYPVRAPVSGTVAFVYLKDGSMIDTRTPLALISGQGKVEINIDVPASVLSSLRPGSEAIVFLNGDTIRGKLESVSAAVNPLSGAGQAKVRLQNSRGLLISGMVVRCVSEIQKKNGVLMVPASALVDRDGRYLVFVIKDGKAREVQVEVGIRGDGVVEVSGELSEGDTVATTGALGLADGVAVEVMR